MHKNFTTLVVKTLPEIASLKSSDFNLNKLSDDFFKTAKMSDIVKSNFKLNFTRKLSPKKLGRYLRADESNQNPTYSKSSGVVDFLNNK